MDSASDSSNFSNHVLGQLHEMAHQASIRGRGNRGRGRGQARSGSSWSQPQQQPHYPTFQQQPPSLTSDSFPPLGSRPPSAPQSVASSQSQPRYQPDHQNIALNDVRHGTPRQYQELARGNYQGGRAFSAQQHRPQLILQQPPPPARPAQYHTNGRPQPRHGQLYNPNAGMHYGTAQQQRAMRHQIMKQSDYLTGIGRKAYDEYKFTQEEKDVKEKFRLDLEKTARNALGADYPDLQLDEVKLKCYGSLANGFALKNCDMDLLLSLPEYGHPEPDKPAATVSPDGEQVEVSDEGEEEHGFKADVQRTLEKTFLDHEYGARLLTQTRVPILRICQTPTPQLLENLRMERAEWEKAINHTDAAQEALQESEVPTAELDAVEQAVTDLSLTAQAQPAKRGNRGNAGLEFTDDCGIQCDINFSNFVALHNSTLLRLYHGFDTRVKEIGIFVKIWAKKRDINTPYRGTLSSYGWILMVLHYLMNVATPPVIPNLQYLAKTEDSWNPDRQIELFEGFDVRFVQDHQGLEEIQQEMSKNRNRESAGQLLRGFFQYYGTNQGFHWTRDIISIRTKGGIVSKQAKGWTEAKWQQGQNKSVRNRYLVAIEDPFEVEHNIARTVGHHGIVTIRNEFRRAWSIIERIGTEEEVPAEEFLTPIIDRVDTLKKDLDAYKQRQLQLRQEVEAKEKAMLQQREAEKSELQNAGTWGDSDQGNAQTNSSPKSGRKSTDPKLTSTSPVQDPKRSKPSGSWRRRKVTVDKEDEDETIEGADAEEEQSNASLSLPEVKEAHKKHTDGLTSRTEVIFANGFDRDGNPVAWDIETQEGRWLHWRDVKIRSGTFRSFRNENYCELNEQCPFDSRRPSPYEGKAGHEIVQRFDLERPPWPANKSNSVDIATNVVGQLIPWDNTTRGGRWLRRRDEHMRLGTWREPVWRGRGMSVYSRLSRAFPYNPEMTYKELNEKNETLRQYHKFSFRRAEVLPQNLPALDTELSSQHQNNRLSSSGVVRRAEPDNGKVSSQGTVTAESDNIPQDSPSFACSTSSQLNRSPNATPRSDGHPSQETLSDKDPTTPPNSERVPNVDFLRMQRLAFFAKHSTSSRSDVDTNDHFYIPAGDGKVVKPADEELETPITSNRTEVLVRSHQTIVPKNIPLEQGSELSEAGASNTINQAGKQYPELSVEMSDSPIKPDFSIRVPATLWPNTADNKRPRDKDPKVMPIPRNIGFQFDPRQLQDLAIISKGGNGCAREGAQFSLEEDEYEWGGGGAMGNKTSTGPPVAGASGGHTPYEAGRGDEDGLLDELPRNWDTCTTTSC
ncbi:hypothetical protein H2200_002615 [Cladophialophora chaetospira]|uniref:polynucleotide adenylyltransferase n=1 Tax=Cladophialophora chaetospira TaxID=386627 RepID=A0AA38XK08_9EURO|nr:hypothetical protein H2200_002615 [Cladophialophora chaetospira]